MPETVAGGVRGRQLTTADIRPRFFHGRDGKPLRVLTLHPSPNLTWRGVCVLLHGHTEFIEKYLEVMGELLARGYAVATMDWRGHGGSHRATRDPLKAHIADFAQYDSDLQVFMDKIVGNLTARPPIAIAHSMGAHVLLRALHARPQQFAAAALIAPMLRIKTRGYPRPLARLVCHAQALAGRQLRWVSGAQADPLRTRFATQLCTADEKRFLRTKRILRENPELRLAGPTWGWLEAAFRSMKEVTARGYAEAITTPALVFGAGRDRIVDTQAVRAFAARLPNGRYEEIADAEHEILMEQDAIRNRFWESFDAFAERYR